MRRNKKKTLASRRNCSKRFFGRNVMRLYFVVEILFDLNKNQRILIKAFVIISYGKFFGGIVCWIVGFNHSTGR
jgi:hypothetical protein